MLFARQQPVRSSVNVIVVAGKQVTLIPALSIWTSPTELRSDRGKVSHCSCNSYSTSQTEPPDFVKKTASYVWGGRLQPKKNRTLPQISNLGLFFSVFFGFFFVFFGFSILANFDWFNGFLLSGSFC